MSSSESPATSPANAPVATSGDGKKPAGNVSAADTVAMFMKMDAQRNQSGTPKTADTSPSPEATPSATEAASSPAAEPAQTSSPEASPEGAAPAAEGQTPEATPETTEAPAPDAQAEEVLSPDSQTLDQKTKDRIQRRIDKEVGKRKALEAQVEALKGQMTAAQQQAAQQAIQATPTAPTQAPLPEIKDSAALTEYKRLAKETERWADKLITKGIPDEGIQVGDRVLSKDSIIEIKWNARTALDEQIPAQEQYFQQQERFTSTKKQVEAAAKSTFNFLADQNHEGYKLATQARQNVSWLNQAVNGDYLTGLLVLGEKARQAGFTYETLSNPSAANKPLTGATGTPKVAPPVNKPKPPSDQTAVSTTGTPARLTPDSARVPKAQGNQTADSAAKLLVARDLARQAKR